MKLPLASEILPHLVIKCIALCMSFPCAHKTQKKINDAYARWTSPAATTTTTYNSKSNPVLRH